VANSSNFKDDILANFRSAGRNRHFSQQSRLHFFSTKSNGIPKKDETDNDPKHDTHAETQPTVWEQLKSVPNIITLTRLASTPLLCYWIVNDEANLAIAGCLLAGMSDVLDGYIAKNHGGSTVLGTYLDPISDKFFINSLAVSLWYSGVLPGPLVFLWGSKDFFLLGGMGWYIYREQRTINFFSNSMTVTPSTLGKANTGLQFATLAIGIVAPVVPPELLHPIVLQSLCWVTGASSIITTLSYAAGGQGFKYTSSKKTSNDKENSCVAADAGTKNNTNTKT
jgi:cardiolipin synthase